MIQKLSYISINNLSNFQQRLFSAHLITQKIDQNFTQNSTGIDIDIKSKNQRNLYKNRNAIGLKINNNMTGATTNSKAIGLKIDLPKRIAFQKTMPQFL